MTTTEIKVKGAREHNLRDVNLTIPRGELICFSGVSGSGKSSLAFDTLYAEGQRRYVESLSNHARHFMGQMPKPDVDLVSGLSPSISISQKSAGNNPRSTVGTITEIYDFLRVLYARVGTGHCDHCGCEITAQSRDAITSRILSLAADQTIWIMAPLARRRRVNFVTCSKTFANRDSLGPVSMVKRSDSPNHQHSIASIGMIWKWSSIESILTRATEAEFTKRSTSQTSLDRRRWSFRLRRKTQRELVRRKKIICSLPSMPVPSVAAASSLHRHNCSASTARKGCVKGAMVLVTSTRLFPSC